MAIADVIRTALGIALSPLPNPPIPMTLSVDERQKLTDNTARIKKDLLKDYEKTLIQKHQLAFDRYNNHGIDKCFMFLKTLPGQSLNVDASLTAYWYRAMNEDEFLKLKRKNEFAANNSYGGIANCRDYSAKYVTNSGAGSIIVEWHIPPAGRLFELMNAANIQYKGENGGISYGLGEAGTNAGQGSDAAFKVFNEYCGQTFKVVDLRIPIRVPQLLVE